jgi:CHAT domain-containing protein
MGVSSLGAQSLAQGQEFDNNPPADFPSSDEPRRPDRPGGGGLGIGAILNLINLLRGSSSSPEVDLSPEVAETRGRLSRLYGILANLYLVEDEVLPACKALEASMVTELEAYLRKRLAVKSDQADCFASVMAEISAATNSPTALVFPILDRRGPGVLVVPPATAAAMAHGPTGPWPVNPLIAAQPQGITADYRQPVWAQAQAPSPSQPFYRVNRDVDNDDVNQAIAAFHLALQDAQSEAYRTPAQQLYDWFIRPIEPDLEAAQIETLVFVTQGGMRVIPPAAFHDGERFLAEKYATVSVTAMPLTNLEARDGRRPVFDHRTHSRRILAMGLSESVENLDPLPGAKTEVETITSQILQGNVFLNKAFTVDNLRSQHQEHQDYDIVHLATHADFVGATPQDSFIQFWNQKLRLTELDALQLDRPAIELLTLSACQTAVGNNLGLAGTAVNSGAKSVLASLWYVSDYGTMPLMLSFYDNLKTSTSKALAIQATQKAMIQGQIRIEDSKITGIPNLADFTLTEAGVQPNLRHPYYWSAFMLVGNWL